MYRSNETQARTNFPNDIAKHMLTIVKDEGVYRHLKMARPGTSNMSFDVITFPDHLVYVGDMGNFVFTRLEDMFNFFRTDNGDINLGYWAEKLVAVDRDNYKNYSSDRFETEIKAATEAYIQEHEGIGDDEVQALTGLRNAVDDDVLSYADDGIQAAYTAAHGFEFEGNAVFDHLGSRDFEDYTYRYIWCLLALVHTITVYDRLKAGPTTYVKPKRIT